MCGIVALIDPRQPIAAARVATATRALAHRGPDERGMWLAANGHAALGHSRLAIIDLHGGSQPISNETHDVHAVVNGELYGYAAARSELERRGHRFRSDSDSELVVHLYEEHGARCVDHLRGEFAFALFDERTGTLFAARDRFGVKPLFYWSSGGQLILASEARALFAAGVDAEWSEDGVFQALHFAQRGHETLFRGVSQVPPGHTLSAVRGTISIRPYWRLDYPWQKDEDGQLGVEEEVHELGSLLLDAVRERTRSDVPLGCYLSGGVDSSTLLAMTQAVVDAPIRAFTIAFDHPEYDESETAAEMARSIGAPFQRIHVTAADLADAL